MSSLPQSVGETEKSFTSNVLWSWLGIGVNLISAVALTPFVVRRLGDEGYGVWALAFSLVEYFWLLDFGFRSATANFVARHRANGETEAINDVVSTAFAYFLVIAALVVVATVIIAPIAPNWFAMKPEYHSDFRWLAALVGVSWAIGAALMVFQASLEGFQRFDLSSRIFILASALRIMGMVGVLLAGKGLVALGVIAVGSQIFGNIAIFRAFRQVFPPMDLRWRHVTSSTLDKMARYGVHTMAAAIATQLLNQSAPLLLARSFPAALVGYYNVPVRLMQMTGVEIASRMGVVSTSKTAELAARGEISSIRRLAIISNRYCLAIFLAPSAFFLTYGAPLLGRWLGPTWADASGQLLPAFILGTGLGVAAQFNSSSILFGLAKHALYARGLLVEGILNAVLLFLFIPTYGLLGAAWIPTILMCLNRGLFLPWVLSVNLGTNWPKFMAAILLRPVMVLVPAVALGMLLRNFVAGTTWLQLALAAIIVCGTYAVLALLTCLEPEHKEIVLDRLRRLF